MWVFLSRVCLTNYVYQAITRAMTAQSVTRMDSNLKDRPPVAKVESLWHSITLVVILSMN